MNAQHLLLSAAGFVLAATAAAASPAADDYLAHVRAEAQARLAATHVELGSQTIGVTATVGADGRLRAVHLARSTGSRDTDFAVEKALKNLDAGSPPTVLIGANVTVALGEGGAPVTAAR
jgi:hypothetical protein